MRGAILSAIFAILVATSKAFAPHRFTTTTVATNAINPSHSIEGTMSRRGALASPAAIALATLAASTSGSRPTLAVNGEAELTTERCIYLILRVQEATTQEERLITSGKHARGEWHQCCRDVGLGGELLDRRASTHLSNLF